MNLKFEFLKNIKNYMTEMCIYIFIKYNIYIYNVYAIYI